MRRSNPFGIGPGDIITYGILIGGFMYVADKFKLFGGQDAMDALAHKQPPPAPGNGAPPGTSIAIDSQSVIPTDAQNGQALHVIADIGHTGPAMTLWADYSAAGLVGGGNWFEFRKDFHVDNDQGIAEYVIDMPGLVVPAGTAGLPYPAMFHLRIIDGNGTVLAASDINGWIRP